MATVTKANLATYLAGLTPSVVPYPVEITETIASDWGASGTAGTVGHIIRTSTPSGVYLDLGLTVIPSSVTNMGYTFSDCTSLTTAPSIPSSVTNMGYTFSDCTSLTTAPSIPSSVTDMSATFSYCTSLTTAPVIPSSVTNMNSTFYNCTSLTTAPTIPPSVTNMIGTFRDCTSLTTAPVIPSSVTYMYYTFYGCTSLTTAPVIPSSVTYMDSTFYGCTSLTTAPEIPSSVTNMFSTFYGCTSLTTIESFSVDVETCIMTGAFSNCSALTAIYVAEVAETTWHLIHTDTDATGTDFTIYKPDGTVAGSGTVAGTSQVMSLYGKSDELVISNNITPTLAQETATSQVQWHKSGLPYDNELMIFNAKHPETVISNVLTTTLRRSASFTLDEYPDGKKIRIANTHATDTITCTLPSGQTMNGAGTISIPAGSIIDIELIGTTWKVTFTDNVIKTALNASGEAPIYACRAWVNFNGTGTVAIRASGNVSSITDNGLGDYTVNFTTAMPDANYSLSTNGENSFASNEFAGAAPILFLSTSCKVLFHNYSLEPRDSSKASLAFFR